MSYPVDSQIITINNTLEELKTAIVNIEKRLVDLGDDVSRMKQELNEIREETK